MAIRMLSAAPGRACCAALFALLFASALTKSVEKRHAGSEHASQADDAESAGERDGVIILKGIYTCSEVEDESKMFGVVKEIKLERIDATAYAASGAIHQVNSIICEDNFAMNVTLMKFDSNDKNIKTTVATFDAQNVTKLIQDNPENTESFFKCSSFPRSCPFGEDDYGVDKYEFDIKPFRKYLPEAEYQVKLIGFVNSKMIWCTDLEFEVQIEN